MDRGRRRPAPRVGRHAEARQKTINCLRFFILRAICPASPVGRGAARRRSVARKPFSRWDFRLPNRWLAPSECEYPADREAPRDGATRRHFGPVTRGWGSQSSDGVGTVVVAGWIYSSRVEMIDGG